MKLTKKLTMIAGVNGRSIQCKRKHAVNGSKLKLLAAQSMDTSAKLMMIALPNG